MPVLCPDRVPKVMTRQESATPATAACAGPVPLVAIRLGGGARVLLVRSRILGVRCGRQWFLFGWLGDSDQFSGELLAALENARRPGSCLARRSAEGRSRL